MSSATHLGLFIAHDRTYFAARKMANDLDFGKCIHGASLVIHNV